MKQDLKLNKENAIAFYRWVYLGEPAKAVDMYVGSKYIQHNPLVGNGKQAFIEYFSEMARHYPNKEINFVRAIAEGNSVAVFSGENYGWLPKMEKPHEIVEKYILPAIK